MTTSQQKKTKYCINCGKEILAGVTICTECGAQAPPLGKHVTQPADLRVALRVSVYTIIVFVVVAYFLIDVWPANTEDLALNATRSVTLYPTDVSFSLGAETSLIFVMIFSGIIGACVFSFFAISHHLGAEKDFDKVWEAWYLLRPVVGAGLALVFYFLLRGGVLTIGADLKNLNLVGVASLAGLVGMFSEQAMIRLEALADTLLGTAPGDEKKKTSKPETGGTDQKLVGEKADEQKKRTDEKGGIKKGLADEESREKGN